MLKNTECMKFLEKDLEQIIWESDKEVLSERGLLLNGKLKRQLRIGNYGISDLVHFKRPVFVYEEKRKFLIQEGVIEIIELKNDKISVSAFMQAIRYLKGIKRYLEKRNFPDDLYTYKITLIGKTIDLESSICYLPDLICNTELIVELYTYNYTINGIEFNSEYGYKLTEENF